ncbi:MAG TPA: hypothetical protein VEC08_03400 [Nitrososphaerales archaeon]|nr:hypothetical protein [Nitrososphaerales archaeon]
MPRKPKPVSKRDETEKNPPPSPFQAKEQFQKLQLTVLARSLQKIDFPLQIPTTREDLVKLQVSLMEMNFNRTITASDFSWQISLPKSPFASRGPGGIRAHEYRGFRAASGSS